MITIWIAAVYTGALWLMGVPLWKCVVVGGVVLLSSYLRFGRRWLSRIAFVLMVIAGGIWLDAIPAPAHWLEALVHIKAAFAN